MSVESPALDRVPSGSAPVTPAAVTRRQVVQRTCARVVPGMEFGVVELPSGGLQVRVDTPAPVAEQKSWVLHHRLAREVALVDWQCDVDADRLLVLDWSAACLHNRVPAQPRTPPPGRPAQARQLRADGPAGGATRRPRPDGRFASELVADVCASIERRLRRPGRLAELGGFERRSSRPRLQLRLAQITGLEARVAAACEEHLAMVRALAQAVCERYGQHGSFVHAQRGVLAQSRPWGDDSPKIRGSATTSPGFPRSGRPCKGPTERRIAASAGNPGMTRAIPAAAMSGIGRAALT